MQLAASLIIVGMLIGYTGFWAYTAKMPISNLQVRSVQPVDVLRWNDPDYVRRFKLTFYNPTDIETPQFDLESLDFTINGTRLVPGTYEIHPLGDLYSVRAHQTLTNVSFIDLHIYQDTGVEGGSIDTVLSALNSTFSLTLSGLIVQRFAGLLIAASPFNVSCRYP